MTYFHDFQKLFKILTCQSSFLNWAGFIRCRWHMTGRFHRRVFTCICSCQGQCRSSLCWILPVFNAVPPEGSWAFNVDFSPTLLHTDVSPRFESWDYINHYRILKVLVTVHWEMLFLKRWTTCLPVQVFPKWWPSTHPSLLRTECFEDNRSRYFRLSHMNLLN